jgi:hypothetical protein
MTGGAPIRRLSGGESVSTEVLRDFLIRALRHDAIADVLLERMVFFWDCRQLDPEGLAIALPDLVNDLLEVVGKEDWIAIAGLLIEDFHLEVERPGALRSEAGHHRGAERPR